jgi:ketosteroid isomerase-like protein
MSDNNSPRQNMAIIARFLDEVWNKGNASAIDDLYAPDGRAKGLGKEFEEGPAMFRQLHQLMLSTCTDIKVVPKQMMAEDDLVMLYFTFDCRHKKSGKPISFQGSGYARMNNGKIAEAYNVVSFMDALVQLDFIPADGLVRALMS